MRRNEIAILSMAMLIFTTWSGELRAQDKLLEILTSELEREEEVLLKQEYPAYYIDYRVDELYTRSISTSFGSLTGEYDNKGRALTTTVKIGDYSFDNTHEFKNVFTGSGQSAVYSTQLPIEDVPDAIKQTLWRATDQAYKNSLSAYTTLLNKKDEIAEETKLADFSKEESYEYFEPAIDQDSLEFDIDSWTKFLKTLTGKFKADTAVFHSEAGLAFVANRKYFVSTEGSHVVQNSMYTQLQIMVSIRHKGGTILPLNKSYTAFHPNDLPAKELIEKDVEQLYTKLYTLREAPMAEAYAGPAILSPGAAGVFFHEIFGHRIEGHRLESFTDGQTFKEKIGNQVLPKDFHVYSDPTLSTFQGQDLIGHYRYDDQGIPAQRVEVVQDGKLQNFLMSRRPTEEFEQSSGHGRAQAGHAPVSRQSNLLIESDKGVSMDDLRKQLIKECKRQDKEYGYYFKEVIGGLTITDRYNTNVFNVTPIEVYRIYVDGRPDELVSGVELIGTPLTMFSNIISASDRQEVFTGFCGAESGHVPVTAIAPALFVKKIETQKTPEFNSKLPILPPPEIEAWQTETAQQK